MLQTLLSRIGWFAALLLLQVLVFNHVHIFGYATPLLCVYFLLILPDSAPRWVYLTSGFALGLLTDLFTNTPGIAAGSLTLCGLVAPQLLRLFAPVDDDDSTFYPSRHTMKWGGFLRFAFSLSLLHCACFFTLEAFSFADGGTLLLNIACSTALTLLLIVAMELVRSK